MGLQRSTGPKVLSNTVILYLESQPLGVEWFSGVNAFARATDLNSSPSSDPFSLCSSANQQQKASKMPVYNLAWLFQNHRNCIASSEAVIQHSAVSIETQESQGFRQSEQVSLA